MIGLEKTAEKRIVTALREGQQIKYRAEKKQQMIDRVYVTPCFHIDQYLISLLLHTLFHQVLGPILTVILIMVKGKVYAQNYGFAPGPFKLSYLVSIIIWAAYLSTAYILIQERYFNEE